MRTGFSLVTQDFVAAWEVVHGDCATWRIVCPACREAVFKGGGDHDRRGHFLSHYPSSAQDVSLCELRVDSITAHQMAEVRAASREQRLAVFQARFREGVERALLRPGLCEEERALGKRLRAALLAAAERLARQPYNQALARAVRGLLREQDIDRAVRSTLRRHFNDWPDFWRERQAEFARDVIAHVIAPTSRDAFYWLFSLGLVVEHHTMSWTLEHGGKPNANHSAERQEGFAMAYARTAAVFVGDDDRAKRRHIGEMRRSPDREFGSLLDRWGAGQATNMMILLLRVPYLELLREALGREEG